MTEQLITIIRVKRREPLTGVYVPAGLEIGWAKEVPPTPEEIEQRKAELRAHNDALFEEWEKYKANQKYLEELRRQERI